MPAANLLTYPAKKIHVGYPGFGPTAPDPRVLGIDDLVAKVTSEIDQPTALIAQSMGGVDVARFGGYDWRPSFYETSPSLPRWFASYQEDLSSSLTAINIPTLLLWGDEDAISPVSLGEHLASLMPNAKLHVVKGGDHDLAFTHAEIIASLIDEHLSNAA